MRDLGIGSTVEADEWQDLTTYEEVGWLLGCKSTVGGRARMRVERQPSDSRGHSGQSGRCRPGWARLFCQCADRRRSQYEGSTVVLNLVA